MKLPLLKTLCQIWTNKFKILEGLKNSIFKKVDVETVAYNRMEICWDCDDLDTLGDKCAFPGTNPCCGKCGCSLQYKLRSLSSDCPRGKWKALMSQEQEDKLNLNK